MNNYFECKVSYDKMLENGIIKKVTEPYLVDALSFAEAEARIIEELRPSITGDFGVSVVRRARISDIFFNDNGDHYFRFKINFITLDEKSGAEKKTVSVMFAQASTLKGAIDELEKGMKGTMADYEIAAVSETNIMDVFKYKSDEQPKN